MKICVGLEEELRNPLNKSICVRPPLFRPSVSGPPPLPEGPMILALSVRQQCCFLRIGSLRFSDFYIKLEFNKQKKMTKPFFEKNSCFAQDRVNGLFLGPKSTFSNFFLHMFLRFFWKLYLITDIKK